jgi:hypothetical protein
VPSRAAPPIRAPEPEPDLVEDIDSFADTLTDTPDVQMADFPVLTDEVDDVQLPPPRPRARTETAYFKNDAPAHTAAPAPTPAAPPVAATPPAAPAPKPPLTDPDADDLDRQTQTVRALAAAKSIDDVSSSMAEALFGESELGMLSAALASAGFGADDAPTDRPAKPAAPPPKIAAPKPPEPPKKTPTRESALAEEDPFDFLGLGRDAPLELIDDSAPSDGEGRKVAGNR